MKSEVEVLNWSSWRNLERTESLNLRLSAAEMKAVRVAAAGYLVRPSDVVRGALIFAGVIEAPAQARQTICIGDDTEAPDKNESEVTK